MVLVDTSVWIRGIAGHEPYKKQLDRLLVDEKVIGHELVHGELLIGDRGGRRNLLERYERMRHAKTLGHSNIVEFVHARGLQGRGIGWIDVHILASALVERVPVWTADPRFTAVAEELGVAYKFGGGGAGS